VSFKYGPKSKDHSSIGTLCLSCGKPFQEGDYTTLMDIGPADAENKIKMLQGKPYTAEAEEIHYSCYIEIYGGGC